MTKAQAREAERPKGKYLLCTSDDTLSAEDVAMGYKQLIEVEDTFRTLKHPLDLRPVHQRTQITSDQHRLFGALRLPESPRIFAITPARAQARAL